MGVKVLFYIPNIIGNYCGDQDFIDKYFFLEIIEKNTLKNHSNCRLRKTNVTYFVMDMVLQ